VDGKGDDDDDSTWECRSKIVDNDTCTGAKARKDRKDRSCGHVVDCDCDDVIAGFDGVIDDDRIDDWWRVAVPFNVDDCRCKLKGMWVMIKTMSEWMSYWINEWVIEWMR